MSDGRAKVVEDNLFLGLMIGDPSIVVLESIYMIFAPPRVDPHVEKFGVCISFLDVGNPSTLFLS
jgi:hypothetical protein